MPEKFAGPFRGKASDVNNEIIRGANAQARCRQMYSALHALRVPGNVISHEG